MAQYARPNADVTTTGVGGGTYASIDESSYSDADFIYGNENAAVTYECGLTNPTDPVLHTGHTFRYRIGKLNGTTIDTGGNIVYCTVSLYQGATLIKADSQKTAGNWTSYDLTLSEAEAGNITDYTDLRLRFVSPASGGSAASRRAIGISWAELEVPNVLITSSVSGAITPSGEVATEKIAGGGEEYDQSVSGSITPDGSLSRAGRKPVAGALTSAGVLVNSARKILSGALTTAGVVVKQSQKALTGALTSSGVVTGIKTALISLAGAITPSGDVRPAAQKILSGALSSAGTLVNSARKILSGALTSAGTLVNSARKILSGALTSAGEVIANKVSGAMTYYQSVSGALTSSGTVRTAARKILSGTLTSAGEVVKSARKVVSGTLTSSGVVVKATRKVLSGVLTTAGVVVKKTSKALAGALTTAGVLVKQVRKILSGVLTSAGELAAVAYSYIPPGARNVFGAASRSMIVAGRRIGISTGVRPKIIVDAPSDIKAEG